MRIHALIAAALSALLFAMVSCGGLTSQLRDLDGGLEHDGGPASHNGGAGDSGGPVPSDGGAESDGDGGVEADGGPGDAGTTARVDGCATQASAEVWLPDVPGLQSLTALAFDGARNLLVLGEHEAGSEVVVLSPAPEHRELRRFGKGVLKGAWSLATDGSTRVYVAQPGGVDVFQLDGAHLTHWDVSPSVQEVAVAPDKKVALSFSGAVQLRSAEGSLLTTVLSASSSFYRPVAWASAERVWVGNMVRGELLEVKVPGGVGVIMGGLGPELGKFSGSWKGPGAFAMDQDALYATDPAAKRVQRFSLKGAALGSFTTHLEPLTLAVEPATRNLYVVNAAGVQVLCPFGLP